MSMDVKELSRRHASQFPVGVQSLIGFANVLHNLFPKRFPQEEIAISDHLNQLGLAVLRYNLEPHNPELITATCQAAFNYWVADAAKRRVELPDIEVPTLEANGDILEKPIKDIEGKNVSTMTIAYPTELQGKKGLVLLGKMFPALQNSSVQENTSIQNENDQPGWLNVEATLDSPNLNSTEPQLKKHFDSLGREGMNENVYILLSQFMKLLKGEFIDVRTLSILLASRRGGDVVFAYFGSHGVMNVRSGLMPDRHVPGLGGRSVRVIQKA